MSHFSNDKYFSLLIFVITKKYSLIVAASLIGMSNIKEQTTMTTTVTKTVNIKARPDKVWDYVNDLSIWPQWAIHNVNSSRKGENGYWLMDGPRGTSKVKMNGNKALGILDHTFIDPDEGHWIVPCRVVKGSEGSHFMITFTKPEQMPHEAFEMGMKLLNEELQKLKESLETN